MRRAALALLALACSAAETGALTLADDRGRTVSLERPAARVVTLAPHLAELVHAAGAGDRLVGVSARSDYPAAARRLPVVSDAGRVDLERIVALRPDLVLTWSSGYSPRQVERIERLGIPVLATEAKRVEDVPRLMRLVAAATGNAQGADRGAQDYEAGMQALASRHAHLRPVRVFIEIWHQPLLSVSGAHLISDLVRRCGGVNVFESAARLTPLVSAEALLAARPEAVIVSADAARQAERMQRWRRQPLVPAVQRGALYALDPDLLERPGPRVLEAARLVCRSLALARGGPE